MLVDTTGKLTELLPKAVTTNLGRDCWHVGVATHKSLDSIMVSGNGFMIHNWHYSL